MMKIEVKKIIGIINVFIVCCFYLCDFVILHEVAKTKKPIEDIKTPKMVILKFPDINPARAMGLKTIEVK